MSDIFSNPLLVICVVVGIVPLIAGGVMGLLSPKLFLLVVKNLRRNLLRTMLTTLAIMFLVFMVTVILTVVHTLDLFTTEKSKDLKLIVMERWQLPSQMPATHAKYLDPSPGNSQFILDRNDVGANDFMTWSFYAGSTEPDMKKFSLENLAFFFVMNPRHIRSMMDELGDLDPALVERMVQTRQGVLIGRERMEALNKRVGERFKVYGLNFKGIDLECEIVGQLPEGRYNKNAIMNDEFFNQAMDLYALKNNGKKHALDLKRLNLIWLRVPDRETFERVAGQVQSASVFADRPVKCETASSGTARFLEPFKDLLWGMKWLLVPAILISMSLVVANAISISVRERYTEMAVLKVLGYRPRQILGMVLGESMLVGGLSGLLASALTYWLFNSIGGIPFPVLWIVFLVPAQALLWGLAIGFGTSLLGSLMPAWSARSVKVSEVFAKVA
jgi:putative ABC transport system permease protein